MGDGSCVLCPVSCVLCIDSSGTVMPASTGLCATVTLTSMCQVERARVCGRTTTSAQISFPTLSSQVHAVRGRLITHHRWLLPSTR